MLLNEVKHTRAETQHQRRVSGKDQPNVRKQPTGAQARRHPQKGLLSRSRQQCQQKDQRKNNDPRRGRLIDQVSDHEDRHHQEGEQRLRVVHHRQGDVVIEKHTLGQRDQVKHHAQIGGVQRHPVQQVAGASQRNQGIEQSYPVEAQRDSKPKD